MIKFLSKLGMYFKLLLQENHCVYLASCFKKVWKVGHISLLAISSCISKVKTH